MITELSVYDGRHRIGSIRENPDGKCTATDETSAALGSFPNRQEAAAAIGRRHTELTAAATVVPLQTSADNLEPIK
jgi:hypothetical protein